MELKQQKIRVIQISLTDLQSLVEISQQTFKETFAAFNTAEDMEIYLATDLSQSALESEMKDEDAHFYFAFYENELAGYFKLNISEQKREFEIERIYILSKFQGKKIGIEMMNYTFNLAKNLNFSRVWLGVWEHNRKAIDFYLKLGFQFIGEKQFILGKDIQRDLIMEIFI